MVDRAGIRPGGPRLYADQRVMTGLMLDQQAGDHGRRLVMNAIERELVREVLDAAARDGAVIDVPTVTWECRVVGREKGGEAGYGGTSQVTGL